MLKKSTNNTFDKGLLMDFNPIVTPNNVLTNCLNGTILTYNGNEYVLQNDMGNGRVETAYLPEGYIPMGTAELGGIIYIVSYNPLKGVCQIGSFPSPERNLTSDEFQEQTTSLSISNFYKEQKDSYTYEDSIISTQQRLILSDKFIYPGDKFQISSIDLNPSLNYLSAFCTDSDKNQYLNPKYLKLSVISISEEGKYENLNDNLVWYPLQDENSESDTEYYIRNIELGGSDEGKVNLDEYRSLTQSNYNIFQGTEKGKLGILAELECIDTFSCGYNISQEVYPSDNTQIRYSPKLYLNWTYTNPINSNKINLYGVRVRLYQKGVDALDKTQYIIIPAIYSVNGTINGGDFDICKYPNEVEFLNYNSDIPSELKRDLTKIAEFGAATDQQEWIRLNQDWLRIKGWYTPTLTPNILRGYIENYITTAKEYINQYLSPRQNNGDDSQIEIDLSTFNLSLDTINSNNILHLEVTPLMPFGAIEYLTQKYTLDLQKIGTGTFDFVRYQYQNYESENIMNIGINTYPEEGASFQDLSVEFYSLTQDIYTRLTNKDTNSSLYNGGAVFDNCNTIIQRGREVWANKKTALNSEIVCDVISNEDVPHVNNQYIGILTNNTIISLNPTDFTDSQIEICKISFKYVKGKEVDTYSYYRIYYPGDTFNDVDQNEYSDFSRILYKDIIDYEYPIESDEKYVSLSNLNIQNYNLDQKTEETTTTIGFLLSSFYRASTPISKNITITDWTWSVPYINNIQSTITNTQNIIAGNISPISTIPTDINVQQVQYSAQNIQYAQLLISMNIPMKYNYNLYDEITYSFKLTPFKVKQYYMGGSGDDNFAWMNISKTLEDSKGGSDSGLYVLRTSKNTDTKYPSNIMPSEGGLPSVIQDMNDNLIDVAILPVYLWQVRGTGTQLSLTYTNTVYKHDIGEGNNEIFTIIFGLRTSLDTISLWGFIFNVDKPVFDISLNTLFSGSAPITVDDQTGSQLLEVFSYLFQKNYKKMPTLNKIPIHKISYTFNIVELELPLVIDYTIKNELTLNNVKIYEKQPIKNLYYNEQEPIKRTHVIREVCSPKEDLESYFDKVIKIGQDIDGSPIENADIDSAIYYSANSGTLSTNFICVPVTQNGPIAKSQVTPSSHMGYIDNTTRVFVLSEHQSIGTYSLQYSSEYEDIGGNKGQYLRFFVDDIRTYLV